MGRLRTPLVEATVAPDFKLIDTRNEASSGALNPENLTVVAHFPRVEPDAPISEERSRSDLAMDGAMQLPSGGSSNVRPMFGPPCADHGVRERRGIHDDIS